VDSTNTEVNPATEDTLATGDLTESDLTVNSYTFDPTVKAVQVVNDGVANITVTVGTDDFVLQPDEARRIQLDSGPIETVTFNVDAVFRMNGIN
jgi:rRNA maturation endonuclease Nob1